MATLTRENFQEFEGVLRKVYDIAMKKKKDYLPLLFNVDTSKRGSEKHMGIGSIGLMKNWTGQVDYDSVGKRWEKTYRHAKYSNGLPLERELFDDEEYAEIKRRTRLLATSVYMTRQTHGYSMLNNAFDTAYTGADTKPLCATDHPYAPDNATDTQSNAGTYDLTPKNLEIVYNKMIDFKDDRGNVLGVNPRLIIVGNHYRKTAKEIVGSDKEPYTGDNTVNIYKDEMNYLYVPWILGKKWFLADPDLMKDHFNWYNRRTPKIEFDPDFDTEVIKYKVVGRWSFGWDEWFSIFGCNVG